MLTKYNTNIIFDNYQLNQSKLCLDEKHFTIQQKRFNHLIYLI